MRTRGIGFGEEALVCDIYMHSPQSEVFHAGTSGEWLREVKAVDAHAEAKKRRTRLAQGSVESLP